MPKHKTTVPVIGFQSDAEKLSSYLTGTVSKLPADDEAKLERVIMAKSLLFKEKSKPAAAQALVNTYKYHISTAYRDLALMEKVYGPLLKMNKELRRALVAEQIEKTRELAETLEDARTMAACDKNLITLYQLDKEDPELPDMTAFEQQTILLLFSPEQFGRQEVDDEDIIKQNKDWLEANTEDIDAEIVDEDE